MYINKFRPVICILILACIVASCSNVRYTYYAKRKVAYTPPEEIKYAKTIPSKPFLTQSGETLKENHAQKKNETPEQPIAKNNSKKNAVSQSEPQKIVNDFDINKFFREHKHIIKAKADGMLDDRTTIIVLLVILILVLLALVGDGLLWLLWLAVLVFLILLLIRYLGLFG